MPSLLIIDDDAGLFDLLEEYLGASGFDCRHAADGDAGLEMLARDHYDAAILDVMLPGKNGHDVLREIRSDGALVSLPVLMLTARGDEEDRIAGLEMGADDYLAKPFGPRELIARLRALLRRAGVPGPRPESLGNLQFDGLIIDRDSQCLIRDGERTQITAAEVRLLEMFAESPGKVLDRESLSLRALGHKPFAQDRSLDMMISRLRKKLGPRGDGGERIRAARGEGYVFLQAGETK